MKLFLGLCCYVMLLLLLLFGAREESTKREDEWETEREGVDIIVKS